MKRYVEVSVPGLPARRFVLVEKALTLGAGPGADLVVQHAKRLASVHLELRSNSDGCELRICAGVESSIAHEGQTYRACLVPWGHDAFVEGVRFSLLEREPEKYSGLVLVVLLALALPVAFIALKDLGITDTATTAPPEAPALAPVAQVSCGQADPEMAAHRADRALLGAQAKVARYPFSSSDGLDALGLYQEASACYRQGGKVSEAVQVEDEAKRWRESLEREYQGHQLRLRLALENKASIQALPEIARLKALLAGVELHPYVGWLNNVERKLKKRSKS